MNSLMVHILVSDAHKMYEFYKNKYGFLPIETMKSEEGKIIWAMFKYRDSSFMIGEYFDFNEVVSSKAPILSKVESPINIYVTCENIDEKYKSFQSFGLEILQEPKDQHWGHRTIITRDLEGYIWIFASEINENKG